MFSQFFNTIKIRNVSSLHRIDYTDDSSQIILFHHADIRISLDPLTYLEEELTINTYVTLRGTTSAPIREITEIRIRDLEGTATGMVGLLVQVCRIIILSVKNACTKFEYMYYYMYRYM